MWLIVGLGNPGPRYADNRHNVGFMVVDELARRANITSFRSKFGGDATTGLLASEKLLLLKPMEYMNHSGYAVQRAAHFHHVEAAQTVVIHDEIDLDFGRLRLKSGGGHGGHNGLRSIIAQLGSSDFLRVRIGVGKPGKGDTTAQVNKRAGGGDRQVASWVLSNFAPDQQDNARNMVERAADATETIMREGIRAAMNEFNKKPTPEETH